MLNSPTSTEKSFSFSKADRFKVEKPTCPKAFYEVPRDLPRQGAKIGRGPRSDFTRPKSQAPSPSHYRIPDYFGRPRGQTFGLAREYLKEQGYLDQSLTRNPGVGKYDSIMRETKQSFTMRPRTQQAWLPNFLKSKQDEQPGPGEYDSQDDQLNRSMNSRYRNNAQTLIGRCERFKVARKPQPGPQSYNSHAIDALNDSGYYTLSRFTGQGKRIMSREQRKSFIDRIVERTSREYNPLSKTLNAFK